MKEMSDAQLARQKTRNRGRYSKMNPCEDCGKGCGYIYYSLPDCNETGVGVTLCKKCHDKRRQNC